MSNINNIGQHLGKDQDNEFRHATHEEKGELLSEYLQTICQCAEDIEVLCGGVGVDIEYLLGVEGSYIIGIRDGDLDDETPPPSELYAETLFPSFENARGIETEVIPEEEELEYDREQPTGTVDEGHVTEDTPDIRA